MSMYPTVKRLGPDGKLHSTPAAYCEAWRRELAPLVELTGWAIHSFGNGEAKLVSPDYEHTQTISVEFAAALRGKLQKTFPADEDARE